jgi:hypothetical protein
MANKNLSQLKTAMRSHRLIRFSRRFEEGTVWGYVLDIGPKFFLLAVVSEAIRLNGFECSRVADVKKLRTDTYAKFAEAALRMRGQRMSKKPRVSVQSIGELLLSAAKLFSLVVISRERSRPHACRIGRVLGVNSSHVLLLEIGPDAKWETSPTELRMSEITQVGFGGDYEGALHLVGGDPPKI